MCVLSTEVTQKSDKLPRQTKVLEEAGRPSFAYFWATFFFFLMNLPACGAEIDFIYKFLANNFHLKIKQSLNCIPSGREQLWSSHCTLYACLHCKIAIKYFIASTAKPPTHSHLSPSNLSGPDRQTT